MPAGRRRGLPRPNARVGTASRVTTPQPVAIHASCAGQGLQWTLFGLKNGKNHGKANKYAKLQVIKSYFHFHQIIGLLTWFCHSEVHHEFNGKKTSGAMMQVLFAVVMFPRANFQTAARTAGVKDACKMAR